MAARWAPAEERDLMAHFLRGPHAVVQQLMNYRGHCDLPIKDFLACSILARFFNNHALSYAWRDKEKSGVECCNRVIGLLRNERNREHCALKWAAEYVAEAEALFADWLTRMPAELAHTQFAGNVWAHVCKTRGSNPLISQKHYTEEQRPMCEHRGHFAWPGKEAGRDAGKGAVAYLEGTYTKCLVGTGAPQVMAILEDKVIAYCMTRVCLVNLNSGSAGRAYTGEGAVWFTFQAGPFAQHGIQLCHNKKVIRMVATVMRELLQGDDLTKSLRHLLHEESIKLEERAQGGQEYDAQTREQCYRFTELPPDQWRTAIAAQGPPVVGTRLVS